MTVSGTYKKSSFGSSIEALCRLTVPIGELTAGAVLGKDLISLVDTYSFKSAPDPINKFGNSTTTLILIHSIRSA